MKDLALHLVQPMVANPDDVSVRVVEGDATVVLELDVHEDDRGTVIGESGRTLRAMRNILSAAAGKQKATLDLIESKADESEE